MYSFCFACRSTAHQSLQPDTKRLFFMVTEPRSRDIPPKNPKYECLEAYARQDAILGSPNPRYKQSTIYCSAYLEMRSQLVGTEAFTDAEWDLTIF